ncbi:MAG: TolC family protein [Bacteroidia bacterium]
MRFFKNTYFLFILCFFAVYSANAQTTNLDYYLLQGRENSPFLKDYSNQVLSNNIDSLKLKTGYKPKVNLYGQLMFAPIINGYGYDNAITNGGLYSSVISVSQDFTPKKNKETEMQQVVLNGQSLGISKQMSTHDLQKNIVADYIAAYTFQEQCKVEKNNLSMLKAEEIILKQLLNKGIYKPSDYLNFKIEMQSEQINALQLQEDYKKAVSELNLLCGINDTSSVSMEAPLVKRNLTSNSFSAPFFMQFTIDSLKITNAQNLISLHYKPKLSWFADAGINSASYDMIYQHVGTSFGLNFSMPIYDGKQRQLEEQKLKISEDTRNGYKKYFINHHAAEIARTENELVAVNAIVQQLNEQLITSQTLIDVSKKQMEQGTIAVTEFVIAVKNQLIIQAQLNQEQLKKLSLINELNYWNW